MVEDSDWDALCQQAIREYKECHNAAPCPPCPKGCGVNTEFTQMMEHISWRSGKRLLRYLVQCPTCHEQFDWFHWYEYRRVDGEVVHYTLEDVLEPTAESSSDQMPDP